jgi:hypothetical protein
VPSILLAALLAPGWARAEECRTEGLDAQVAAASERLAAHAPELAQNVLRLGLRAFFRARCRGEAHKDVLSIIDYSLPSSMRRLWVFDVARAVVLFRERVAHGRGSGEFVASHFSDAPDSHATSLGLFVTGATYRGKHGYSLAVDGKELGTNDRARDRAIVVHPADYMTDAFVAEHGRAGRSFGCPALDPNVARPVIDTIKDGSVLWAYYPDPKWLRESPYLKAN